MITTRKMYGCKCDGCGERWIDFNGFVAFPDTESIQQEIDDDPTWEAIDDKHYCPNCWAWDEEGNLIIKPNKL